MQLDSTHQIDRFSKWSLIPKPVFFICHKELRSTGALHYHLIGYYVLYIFIRLLAHELASCKERRWEPAVAHPQQFPLWVNPSGADCCLCVFCKDVVRKSAEGNACRWRGGNGAKRSSGPWLVVSSVMTRSALRISWWVWFVGSCSHNDRGVGCVWLSVGG